MSTVDALREFQKELTNLKKAVDHETGPRINRQSTRKEAERLGSKWFADIHPSLGHTTVSADVLEEYSKHFKRLIKISAPNNLRSSYQETLRAITKKFRSDLILALQTTPTPVTEATSFDALFAALTNTAEDVYLKEAVECARAGFLRAAAVLGWCAAIDRIHRAIECVGFAKFNVTSASMASQQHGRFKRFNKPQNVGSLGELRLVFDTDILWIIEGMELIDSNQHTRLRSCFELRTQSAHPGDAPVTVFNLMSFFSDIIEIVLRSPKFAL